MAILQLEFDPLNTPLRQRIETLVTALFIIIFIFGGVGSVILTTYLLLFTQFWWLCILYLFYDWVYDRTSWETEDRRQNWARGWILFRYVKNYFPIKLVKLPSVELDPGRNYLFCSFPHGLICTGVFITLSTDVGGFQQLFPNHRSSVCGLNLLFYFPFFRHFALAMGGRSPSAKSLNSILGNEKGGNVATLVVGGAVEACYCKPGSYKINWRKRKGFVKLALQNGSPLVPVISFGETDIFDQVEGTQIKRFQEWSKKLLTLPLIIFRGRGIFQRNFGLVPHRHPIHVVVGKPLDIQKIVNPTTEEIDEIHRKFLDHVVETFESQKKYYIKDYEKIHIELA